MWLQNGSSSATSVRLHAVLVVAGVPPRARVWCSRFCSQMMAVLPTLYQPTKQSPRYAPAFVSLMAIPLLRALSVDCFMVLTPIPSRSMISRSSRTLRISPNPRTPPRMIRRTGTSSSYVKRRGTRLNQRIISTRNVTLSCTISRSERRSKSYIGHSKTMKNLLHCPLSESFHSSRPAAGSHSTSYLTSIQYVTLALGYPLMPALTYTRWLTCFFFPTTRPNCCMENNSYR